MCMPAGTTSMGSRCSMPATRMRGIPRAPASCVWAALWPMASEAATWPFGTRQPDLPASTSPCQQFLHADWAAGLAMLGCVYTVCSSSHLAWQRHELEHSVSHDDHLSGKPKKADKSLPLKPGQGCLPRALYRWRDMQPFGEQSLEREQPGKVTWRIQGYLQAQHFALISLHSVRSSCP